MKHDFLKLCDQGQDVAFEDKPLDIIRNPHIIEYKIFVRKFGDDYNFQNSEELVNDFLNSVRSKFKSAGPVLIKCGFTIEIFNSLYWKI